MAEETGTGGNLIRLDQSKTFNRVNHLYLVLKAADLGLDRCNAQRHSVVKVNGHPLGNLQHRAISPPGLSPFVPVVRTDSSVNTTQAGDVKGSHVK